MAQSLAEVRKLTDEEIEHKHDQSAQYTEVGVNYYLAELDRRSQERQTQAMIALNVTMVRLTWVTVFLAFVGIVLAAVGIIKH